MNPKYSNTEISKGRYLALIAYLSLIGLLISWLANGEKNNRFVWFHIRQSFGIWISFWCLGYFIGFFDSWTITGAFWIAFICLCSYGIISAINGKSSPIPFIGTFFQKIKIGR